MPLFLFNFMQNCNVKHKYFHQMMNFLFLSKYVDNKYIRIIFRSTSSVIFVDNVYLSIFPRICRTQSSWSHFIHPLTSPTDISSNTLMNMIARKKWNKVIDLGLGIGERKEMRGANLKSRCNHIFYVLLLSK